MTDNVTDFSSNLSRRYRHLFRLPSRRTSILLASLPVIMLELIIQSTLHASILRLLLLAFLTEATLLVSIEIDRRALVRHSGIANYRRLSAISIIGNALWLLAVVLGRIVLYVTGSEGRFLGLVVLGVFLAIAFRAFIFGSVFYGNTIHGLPLSFVQPLLLLASMTFPWTKLYSSGILLPPAVLSGLIFLIAIELYLYSINNSPLVGGMKPLHLLQAFLGAWTLQEPAKIEDILQKLSRVTQVDTSMIGIENRSGGENALLIVPGIHPGPFHPIGSSNLPGDIYEKLRTQERIPLTVHSISDHELNLPSKAEVENYIASLKDSKKIDEGSSISTPIVSKKGKATVTGIAFGSACMIALTQAPYGMEDFPTEVREEIDGCARRLGFRLSLVIDAHNSEGAKPNDAECEDAVDAAEEVLVQLTKTEPRPFKIGFAHSSEHNKSVPADIGPAGIGLLYFEINNQKFCLVIADANNCKLGFREEVLRLFEEKNGTAILELCTSDTHVTAARTVETKGYLALGDLISASELLAILSSLFEKAKGRVSEGSYTASSVTSNVRTIGGEILETFSGLTDVTAKAAKRGAMLLAILGVVLIALVALV